MSLQTTDAPAPVTDRVPVPDLPPPLYTQLCAVAVRHGVPVDDVMEYILRAPASSPRNVADLSAICDAERIEARRAERREATERANREAAERQIAQAALMREAKRDKVHQIACRNGNERCPTPFLFRGTWRCGCVLEPVARADRRHVFAYGPVSRACITCGGQELDPMHDVGP